MSKYAGCYALADTMMKVLKQELLEIPQDDVGRAIMLVNGRMTQLYAELQLKRHVERRSNKPKLAFLAAGKARGSPLYTASGYLLEKFPIESSPPAGQYNKTERRTIASSLSNTARNFCKLNGIEDDRAHFIETPFGAPNMFSTFVLDASISKVVSGRPFKHSPLGNYIRCKLKENEIQPTPVLIESVAKDAAEPTVLTMPESDTAEIDAFFNN